MLVLGIETTCDETAAAVVDRRDDGRAKILSNIVLSQVNEHAAFGGVVPEIAARAHVEVLDMIIGKASPRMLARARAYAEHLAAVGRVDAKVCREMTVGIAQRDSIQGAVVEVGYASIGVRIDDAGKFLHTLNGTEIVRGMVLWDAPTAWVPCL